MEDSTSLNKLSEDVIAFLKEVIVDSKTPKQMRIEASKTLLPYIAKKAPTHNINDNKQSFLITDERLRSLDDDDLRTLIRIMRKLTNPGESRVGGETSEVQHD